MLIEILTKFKKNYLDLPKFENLEQFDNYYLNWWLKSNEDQLDYEIISGGGVEDDEVIITGGVPGRNRSRIVDGTHLDAADEKDRQAWLKSCFRISIYTSNITSPILARENLEIQKAMFRACISEFNELYNQICKMQFLLERYPFILNELISLKESVVIKCSYLAEANNVLKMQSAVGTSQEVEEKERVKISLAKELITFRIDDDDSFFDTGIIGYEKTLANIRSFILGDFANIKPVLNFEVEKHFSYFLIYEIQKRSKFLLKDISNITIQGKAFSKTNCSTAVSKLKKNASAENKREMNKILTLVKKHSE